MRAFRLRTLKSARFAVRLPHRLPHSGEVDIVSADMGYYVRAFCTSGDLPPLRTILESAKQQGMSVELETEHVAPDLDSPDWREAELRYKPGNQPIPVDVIRSRDELLSDEIEEFVEFLEDAPDSAAKDKVLQHLRETKAIVATQLLGDVDDDGYAAAGTFLNYFVEHCGGMIQADAEGFYEGDELIVELE